MSAEYLRETAVLMRERARAATSGPWYCDDAQQNGSPTTGVWSGMAGLPHVECTQDADAEHIASFGGPPVALAVAALLDAQADAGYWEPDPDSRAALHLAKTYRGETA